MKVIKELFLALSAFRLIPHVTLLLLIKDKKMISSYVDAWSRMFYQVDFQTTWHLYRYFIILMTFRPEYRNLFYYRIRKKHPLVFFLLKPFCSSMPSLYIATEVIGKALILQHGFSTIISAKRIGDNCKINQQVTIGYSNNSDAPILGNNVMVHAGAKVIGGITIGDNVIIGANAVVVKDVPPNCTVVGVPAYIVRRDGRKVREDL